MVFLAVEHRCPAAVARREKDDRLVNNFHNRDLVASDEVFEFLHDVQVYPALARKQGDYLNFTTRYARL